MNMTEAQYLVLLTETKGELNTPPGFSEVTLTGFIKAAEFDIRSKVASTIDFEVDLKARELLKTYIRYSYYGLRDEFKIRYDSEYHELQVDYAK